MKYAALLLTLVFAAPAPLALGQSNTIPGHDISLFNLGEMKYRGREGTYPNGKNGFSMLTTVCNTGMNQVNWFAAMNPDHPFISFLVVREKDGRLV
jgi:hypothetical protein